jgi:hypothetical protein
MTGKDDTSMNDCDDNDSDADDSDSTGEPSDANGPDGTITITSPFSRKPVMVNFSQRTIEANATSGHRFRGACNHEPIHDADTSMNDSSTDDCSDSDGGPSEPAPAPFSTADFAREIKDLAYTFTANHWVGPGWCQRYEAYHGGPNCRVCHNNATHCRLNGAAKCENAPADLSDTWTQDERLYAWENVVSEYIRGHKTK